MVFGKPMKLVWIGFSSFHKNRLVFKLFFNPCLEDSSTTPHLLQPTWQQACSWIRLRVLCCHETNTTSSPDGTSSTTCHARSGVDRHCYGLLWGFTVLICTLACLREDAWQNREADNACVWYARFLLSRNRRWRLFFQNPGTDISSCWLGGLFCVCILCIYFPGFRNSELKLCSYMFLQLMADVLDIALVSYLELVPPKFRVLSRKCCFHYHQTVKWSYQNTALLMLSQACKAEEEKKAQFFLSDACSSSHCCITKIGWPNF
jgi:hypothetical protein